MMLKCIHTPIENFSLTLELKMEGFFEKYRSLFKTECHVAGNGQGSLWSRKPQKSGYGAVN